MKGQTAIEYLMTYGWAVLIIVVVILALWSLGVFTQKIDSNICEKVCSEFDGYGWFHNRCECKTTKECLWINDTKFCQEVEITIYYIVD